jgi:hypothetical protein
MSSKTTKTELLAEIDALKAERQRVVDVALKVKKERGFCDEVDRILVRAGLGELLPNLVIIQTREASNGAWTTALSGDGWRGNALEFDDSPENREKALATGRRKRSEAIAAQVSEHKRIQSWKKRQHEDAERRRNRGNRYFEVNLTKDTDVTQIAKTVQVLVDELKSGVNVTTPFVEKPLKVLKYPQFRVVVKKALTKAKDVEVLEVFDSIEPPA